FAPLVGDGVWQDFVRQVDAHAEGQASAFTELNSNSFAALVDLGLAPAGLPPATDSGLVLQPMTLVDVIEASLVTGLPRKTHGNEVAAGQAEWLRRTRDPLLQAVRLGPETEGPRDEVLRLYDEIVEVVGREHPDYETFRAELDPWLREMKETLCGRDDSDLCFYAPPALFTWAAQGRWPTRRVTIDYVGHGLHYSLVRPADG
ncbi:MAG: hypothetical protein R3190_01520, partial [Thermoanaerobaculia bacterium]|nr:hypothetical protein [Thermoanaerobaculia bacterium]